MDSDDCEHSPVPLCDLNGLPAIPDIRAHGEYEFDFCVDGPSDHFISVPIELWHSEVGMGVDEHFLGLTSR